MSKKDIADLLERYNKGLCTDEEVAMLESWYLQQDGDPIRDLSAPELRSSLQNITRKTFVRKRSTGRLAIAAAAAVLLLSVGAAVFLTGKKTGNHAATDAVIKNTIRPGSNKAILILGNGKQIALSDLGNGEISHQAGTKISKDKSGQVSYTAYQYAETNVSAQINKIETPAGGQWHIILADSTQVWLNASSSLSFPEKFNGTSREVMLTGEGYFEVAHDQKHPFIVHSAGQEVQVLGTHFNINAYSDEPTVKTTLLQGSVKVSVPVTTVNPKILSAKLVPGEQAQFQANGLYGLKLKKLPDPDVTVAWKNGIFSFDHEDVPHLMRMIARWYKVSVRYDGPVTKESFSGSLSRFGSVSDILAVLEATGKVHFHVENNEIAVTR